MPDWYLRPNLKGLYKHSAFSTCMYVCVSVSVRVCAHIHMYSCVCVYIYMPLCVYGCAFTCVYSFNKRLYTVIFFFSSSERWFLQLGKLA